MPGGRPAGSTNKNSVFLLKRMQDMLGEDFDPVVNMARNAAKLQAIADEVLEDEKVLTDAESGTLITYAESLVNANKEWERIAPYVAAKLKAVEISQGTDPETGEAKEWKITVVKPSDT